MLGTQLGPHSCPPLQMPAVLLLPQSSTHSGLRAPPKERTGDTEDHIRDKRRGMGEQKEWKNRRKKKSRDLVKFQRQTDGLLQDKMTRGGGQGGPAAVATPRWPGRRSPRRAAGAGGPQGAGEVLPPPPARCPGRSEPHLTPRRPRPRLCGAGNTPRRPARTCSFLATPSLLPAAR